ncbi:hypothetical protein K3495_g4307 [Podosphaera aphanis]|nr:hypothetical protein K3495_g4307 [Podosphaera aphanis]
MGNHSISSVGVEAKLLTTRRIHEHSRIFRNNVSGFEHSFEENFGGPRSGCTRDKDKDQRLSEPKRIRLWKSIILSTLDDETLFPYCLFIRCLDLEELKPLIRSTFYRPVGLLDSKYIADIFHTSDLSRTEYTDSIDNLKIIKLVGDSLIAYICKPNNSTANLKRIRWLGENNDPLTRWISRLENLNTLVIRLPFNLGDLAKTISKKCPEFHTLVSLSAVRNQFLAEADQSCALFLKGLKKNTLRKFTIQCLRSLENFETFLALNHHAESLKELKFQLLYFTAANLLHLPSACQSLTSLQLNLVDLVDPEMVQSDNGQFQTVVDWICSCRNLRELSLGELHEKAILTEVCSKNWICLQKLEIHTPIEIAESEDFLRALTTQTKLEHLSFKMVFPAKYSLGDIHMLISPLSRLSKLRYLDLRSTSSPLHMNTVIKLASYFPKLEKFAFTCKGTTDLLWPAIAYLHHLQSLTIAGLTYFSFHGILAFVGALPTFNKGFELSIEKQDRNIRITVEQIRIVKDLIRSRISGYFEIRHSRRMGSTVSDPEDLLEEFAFGT